MGVFGYMAAPRPGWGVDTGPTEPVSVGTGRRVWLGGLGLGLAEGRWCLFTGPVGCVATVHAGCCVW